MTSFVRDPSSVPHRYHPMETQRSVHDLCDIAAMGIENDAEPIQDVSCADVIEDSFRTLSRLRSMLLYQHEFNSRIGNELESLRTSLQMAHSLVHVVENNHRASIQISGSAMEWDPHIFRKSAPPMAFFRREDCHRSQIAEESAPKTPTQESFSAAVRSSNTPAPSRPTSRAMTISFRVPTTPTMGSTDSASRPNLPLPSYKPSKSGLAFTFQRYHSPLHTEGGTQFCETLHDSPPAPPLSVQNNCPAIPMVFASDGVADLPRSARPNSMSTTISTTSSTSVSRRSASFTTYDGWRDDWDQLEDILNQLEAQYSDQQPGESSTRKSSASKTMKLKVMAIKIVSFQRKERKRGQRNRWSISERSDKSSVQHA